MAQTAAMLVGTLVKRLQMVDDRRRFPEIADEVITAPLFIVGAAADRAPPTSTPCWPRWSRSGRRCSGR